MKCSGGKGGGAKLYILDAAVAISIRCEGRRECFWMHLLSGYRVRRDYFSSKPSHVL